MTKADVFRAAALELPGRKYKLGEEPWYIYGTEQTKDPMDGDCSGIGWALFKKAGVLSNGKAIPRLTADDYFKRSSVISGPYQVGDAAYFPRVGRKTHVVWYIGRGPKGREAYNVIEAGNHGPGGVYPGSGYMGLCTTAQINARDPVWARLPGLDIGALTKEEEMTEAQIRKLVQDTVAAEMAKMTVCVWPPDLNEARQGIADLGILETRHPGNRAVSVDMFRVGLWRLAKKVGVCK